LHSSTFDVPFLYPKSLIPVYEYCDTFFAVKYKIFIRKEFFNDLAKSQSEPKSQHSSQHKIQLSHNGSKYSKRKWPLKIILQGLFLCPKIFLNILENQEHFVCTYVVDKCRQFCLYIAKLVCGVIRIRKISCPFEAVNLSD